MREKSSEILIIEDDKPIRDSLKGVLELEGYHVHTAPNGKEGLTQLRNIPHPCLILLDLFMPVMSGIEFLQEVQKDKVQGTQVPPIVVISASPPDGEAAVAVKPMTQGFVKKPVDLNQFLALVERYCSCQQQH
jgi:CheY-like chemotaxis protein